jgi:hypothetical protein
MTALLAAVATAYAFAQGGTHAYKVDVVFDGFLPLLGGNEGKAEVSMDVRLTGNAPVEGKPSATSEITAFDISFNGARLPLTLENVTDFFPRTTVVVEPTGKIVSNDAPDRRLPVRLPGLDVRRFPDITYVPIEFAGAETGVGDSWEFERDFGGNPLKYTCRAASLDDGLLRVEVTVVQEYTVLENDSLEVVAERSRAVREVTTRLEGKGHVVFDTGVGVAREAVMVNVATSEASPLAGGEPETRKLTTTYNVKLLGPRQVSARPEPAPWWRQAAETAQLVMRNPGALVGMLQIAAAAGLQRIPRRWEAVLKPLSSQLRRWLPMRAR